jgi:hypothetical protein
MDKNRRKLWSKHRPLIYLSGLGYTYMHNYIFLSRVPMQFIDFHVVGHGFWPVAAAYESNCFSDNDITGTNHPQQRPLSTAKATPAGLNVHDTPWKTNGDGMLRYWYMPTYVQSNRFDILCDNDYCTYFMHLFHVYVCLVTPLCKSIGRSICLAM